MEFPWPEKVAEELNRGRELTRRLREMIGDGNKIMLLAEDLVGKILGSFCETLSILEKSNECSSKVDVGKSPQVSSVSSCKTSPFKDRRGSYKRRKYRKTSETSIKETSTLVDDGHAWRKYGQKQIHQAKYPRNYFRCTHKFDQGCMANKQVQRIQENPPLFRITYSGHHTCKTFPRVTQIICDSPTDDQDSSVLLNFSSSTNHYHLLDMMVENVEFVDLFSNFEH